MKKISVILIVMMLVSMFSVYAEKSLSIEDVKKLAIENSNSLKAADLKIEYNEINAREALASKNRTKNNSAPPGYGVISIVETTLLRRGYYSDVAASQLEISKLDKEKSIDLIEKTAIKSYYDYNNAQEKLRIKYEALKLAQDNAKLVKLKYDLGTASKYDLQLADYDVDLINVEIDSVKRAVEYARLSFNKAIGIDESEAVILTDNLEITIPEQIDIDAKIKEVLESRYEIIATNYKLTLAQKEAECYGAFYTKSTYFYKLKEYNVEIAKEELDDTKKNIALSIKKSYFDYLDCYNTAVSSNVAVLGAELELNYKKSKFDNDMITNQEVIKAQNQLDSKKQQKVEAQTAYYISKLGFERNID